MRFSPGSLTTKRKARRAAHDFASLIGEAVNATVSQAPIAFVETTDAEVFDGFVAHAPNRVQKPLRLENDNYLLIFQRLCLRREQKFLTTREYRYVYQSSESPNDWIFRFEYEREPEGDNPYPRAHIHLNACPTTYSGAKEFDKLHLPTGRVTLEDILRHLVIEHAVQPVSPNWEQKLKQTEAAFREIQRKRFQKDSPVCSW